MHSQDRRQWLWFLAALVALPLLPGRRGRSGGALAPEQGAREARPRIARPGRSVERHD